MTEYTYELDWLAVEFGPLDFDSLSENIKPGSMEVFFSAEGSNVFRTLYLRIDKKPNKSRIRQRERLTERD